MVSGTTLDHVVSADEEEDEEEEVRPGDSWCEGNSQEDDNLADDAPAGVPDESAVFVERFVEGRP